MKTRKRAGPCDASPPPDAIPGPDTIAEAVDQAPVEIVLVLPTPPSVNGIWRAAARRVYRSEKYLDWASAADAQVMVAGYPRRRIVGPFEIDFVFEETRRGRDLDNMLKAPLDWLESRSLIRNDSDCRRLSAAWGDAVGVRIVLREVRP